MIYSLKQSIALIQVQQRIADHYAALDDDEREWVDVEMRHSAEIMPDELGDVDVFVDQFVEGAGGSGYHSAKVDLDGNIEWFGSWAIPLKEEGDHADHQRT